MLTPGLPQSRRRLAAPGCGRASTSPRRAGAVVAAQTRGWLVAAGTAMADSGKPRWCALHFRAAEFFLKGSLREMFSHLWIKMRTCTYLLEARMYGSICNSTEEREAALEEPD